MSRTVSIADSWPTRRALLIQWMLMGSGNVLAQGTETARVVDIEARRFQYKPNLVTLKRGEKVTLAFRAIDFIHGFHAPDFKLRADLLPGQITEIELQPMSVGRFPFLCDNFCGDEHESMSGVFVVEA